MIIWQDEAISVEDFIELRKMRKPRPADFVPQHPQLKDTCYKCGNLYIMELAVIDTWSPMTLCCPDCYGISAS